MFQRSRRLRLEALEDRRLLSVASLGDSFTANTETSGDQLTFGQARAASVANDEEGNFVAVWSGKSSESDGFDVFGQLFDSTGSPVGEEFQVNVATTSEQIFPAVAMDDDGDFVVTWSSLWQDSSLYGVYARRYDASGTAQGGEFRVNTTTDNNQNFSAVAMDSDGDFTIAWTSTDQDGDKTGIYARRYSADGTATTEEIAVNTTTDGNQRYPVIGSDSVGGTIVVWTSEGQDGSSGGIFAQRLAADGTLVGDEFQVNTTTEGNQQLPSVAVSPGGNFLVSWQSFDLTAGEWMVYVQAYDADGALVGTENAAAAGRHVSAAITDVGDFVVAWEGESSSEAGRKEIHVQHFDPLGNANGAMTVYGSSDASLTAPSIAVRGDVAVILSTSTGDDGEGSDVYGQRVQTSLTGSFNQPPTLILPSDVTAEENETISLTVSATDPDEPAQDLTFVLTGNPPSGAALDTTTGQFSWTPDESAGGQTFEISVRVTDSGSPALSDQGVFQITVGEANLAPTLAAVDDATVDEGSKVVLGFSATDDDTPAQTLTYSIDPGAPAEAAIDASTGRFSWTPGEAYGGGQYTITVTVTDDGTPSLSDSTSVTITVNEVNSPPAILDPGEQLLELGETLSLLLEADDPDEPANTLTWALDTGAPAGATIDPTTGLLTWTPTIDDGLGSHTIPVLVTDDGSPNESDSFEVEIIVEASMLDALADQIVDEETELSVQPVLTAPYDQATGLTFSLDSGAPAGAAIDAETGLFTWTPTEKQGPGEYTVTVRVTDDADSAYTDSESFTVTVLEVNAVPQLEPIADISVAAGTSFYLPLKASDSDSEELVFSVATADSQLAATVSDTNRSLRLVVSGFGTMEFELFEDRVPVTTSRIIELVESGFYDGLLFHRVAQGDDGSPFVIQGGDPNGDGTGGSGTSFDDEFHVELLHTAAGVLSMANSGDDTNDSQFFITGQATRFLDFNHAVFGYQTAGEGVRLAIEAVETDDAEKPVSDVVIETAEIFVDPQTGLLVLVAPEGFEGQVEVTVTVADGAGAQSQQTFYVNVVADDDPYANSPPFLESMAVLQAIADQSITFDVPATDIEDDPIYYSAEVVDGASDLTVTIDEATGQVTITPSASAGGVYAVRFAVGAASGEQHDTQLVPVLVQPAAPVSLALATAADTGWSSSDGLTRLNNDTGSPLIVEVGGVVAGATVTVYADGELLGTRTATAGGTLSITTNESYVLTDGVHALTAVQTFSALDVAVGNWNEPVDLTSEVSASVEITVDTVLPEILSTAPASAVAYVAYVYDVETEEEATGDVRYELGNGPSGMSIDTATGVVSWPSPTTDGSPYSVTVRAVDEAGNVASQSYALTVVTSDTNQPPELAQISDSTVNEGEVVSFTVAATDGDSPAQSLSFSLDAGAPSAAWIDPVSGAFVWTTSEADGPGVYSVTVRVTDDGSPAMSDWQTVTITVLEVNTAPVLAAISDQTVSEGTAVEFTAAATDVDLPEQTLTFSLDAGAPSGATIDPATGEFSWTPAEGDAPGVYPITVRVTDDGPGLLDASQSFTITVEEGNSPPVLASIADQTVVEGATVSFTASATDADLPAQTLRFSLDAGAPAGAAIDPVTGFFSWATTEADGPGQYSVTVRVTDDGVGLLSAAQSFTITVTEGNTAPVLDAIPSQTVTEGDTVQFVAVASDTDVPAQTLTFSLGAGAPAGATIDPLTGRFTWATSEPDGPGFYSVTIRVTDDGPGALAASQSFTITVEEANTAPVLAAIADWTITEGSTVQFTATATDVDLPAQTLTYSLDVGAPQGASVDAASGQFTWTPGEADAPGDYAITIRVTDDGPGSLDDARTFTVHVEEGNSAPVLSQIADQAVTEGGLVQFQANATDSDLPAQSLTFSLDSGAPAGAAIDPTTGWFTWSTTERDGPGLYSVTIRVTDDGPGSLHDSETFTITVDEDNTAPVLAAIPDQAVTEGSVVEFIATATDSDLPVQTLTYSLGAGAPAGASIDPGTGRFTWSTTEADGPGFYSITIRVADNGPASLDDTQSFTITVNEGNSAPVLAAIPNQTVTEGATVQFTVSATDGDVPTQSLAYSLDAGAPSGASINGSTGLFTWTTTEADGPGVYTITVRVTDNGSPALSDSQSFTVTVAEKNVSPSLAEIADQTVTEGGIVQFTASATDGDVPAQTLTYSLDSGAPSGASINPSTGRFTWTTTETDGPGVYTITVRVTDDGSPALSDSESFTVTVNEKNAAPVLADIGDQTVTEGATVRFTALATDGDVPTQSLTYSLDAGAPAAASINADTGLFTWTTAEADGPGVYTITVRVTDDGSPALSDSESFTVTVNEKNAAPVLASIGDQTVSEGATVQFTASATDSDVPAQSLTFSLDSGAPTGASIDAHSGKFTWTTAEADGPGVYTITVRVTDSGSPASSDSESFVVTVNDTNAAPVLAEIGNQTVTEGATVQFTASATDGDVPAQSLIYSLDSGAPSAARINASTGKFTWTTTEADAPGVYTITVRVTDNGSPALSDSESFTVTVEEKGTTGGEIAFSGSTALVTGTDGNDKVRIELGATHIVAINDRVFSIDPSLYTTIEIDTGEGDDALTLVGTASDESAILRPGSLQFTGTDCQVAATGTETIRVEGGGGSDVGRFYGTEGDDHLSLGPNWGQMIGTGFSLELADFGELHGIGGLEDHDTVEIFDSSGDDVFIGKPEYSTLTGDGYYVRAKWFYEVVATATEGGNDEARLVDSDYDDLFVATPSEASMTGPGYVLRTEGFETVHGYARCGGDDVAKLYDSAGDDTFKATPEYAKMIGDGYYLRAKFFEQMLGYSTAGGNDIARFYDSTGDDTYTGTPSYAWLSGVDYFLRAKSFDQYRAQASEGKDVAFLYDSALDDLLTAGGNRATLSTSEQSEQQMVTAFDEVTAESGYDDDNDATNVAALDFLLTLEGSW